MVRLVASGRVGRMTEGYLINKEIRESGVCPLVTFDGSQVFFYPKRKLPVELQKKLHADDKRLARQLAVHLVNVARS